MKDLLALLLIVLGFVLTGVTLWVLMEPETPRIDLDESEVAPPTLPLPEQTNWTPPDVDAERARIVGRVTYDGVPPAPRDLTPLVEKNADREHCKLSLLDQTWLVGKEGGVANVVVWIRPTDGRPFHIPEKLRVRTDIIKIDSPHCMFEPRVLVHFPTYPDPEKKKQVETGQKLLICNSAPIAHSPFWRPQNPSINPSGPSILRDEHRPSFRPCAAYEFGGSDRVRIICNLHFWMKAYVWVFDHPFSAVSSGGRREENILGNFVIDAVPVGRKVELVYWHESLYWHEPFGGRILKKFTIAPGDNRIDFKIKQPQRSSSNRDTAKLRTP